MQTTLERPEALVRVGTFPQGVPRTASFSDIDCEVARSYLDATGVSTRRESH